MSDLKFAVIEQKPGRFQAVLLWLPQGVLALFFVWIGLQKFAPAGIWVRIFDRIGFGQWFRYFTGALQIGGGLLMLPPRAGWIGAIMLACTMAGAVVAQIVVFRSPTVIVPAVLMGILVAIALRLLSQRHD